MDRALKERIIGAAVLVVFVVLVVPVFLDGPPDNGEIVSERVPLPGQAAEGETRTVVLERDRDEPVPAAAVEPETRRPQPAQTGAAEQPESKPEPDPAPETEPHGSFGNEQNAERLAADLRKQGFAAFLSQLSKDSGQLHRVRIGPQKDRESAEAMAERLAKAGHKGQVVPHP
jgi:DedD protein